MGQWNIVFQLVHQTSNRNMYKLIILMLGMKGLIEWVSSGNIGVITVSYETKRVLLCAQYGLVGFIEKVTFEHRLERGRGIDPVDRWKKERDCPRQKERLLSRFEGWSVFGTVEDHKENLCELRESGRA